MNRIDLRSHVRSAITRSWEAFEHDHPHLAAAVDQELLVDSATRALDEDPEYQSALRDAHLAGIAIESAGDIIDRFVIQWLKRLL